MAQGQFLNKTGEQGPAGEDGVDGAQWLDDFGPPDSSIGEPGDFYIDLKTADVYRKIKKTWVLRLNIEGPRGKAGKDGADGKDAAEPAKTSRFAATGGGFAGSTSFDVDTILTGYNSAGELSVLVNELGNVLVGE